VSAALKRLLKRCLPRPVYFRVRNAYRGCRLRRYPAREVEHTFGGSPLRIVLADPVAAGWYDTDWPELPEIAVLRRHRLRPGARVFNLGAHQCIVAAMLAREVGRAGQVVAVEAEPFHVQVAQRNRDLNNLHQLTLVWAAAGEEVRSGAAGNPRTAFERDLLCDWRSKRVRSTTVDDLAQEFGPPDVLFIDVDGYECQVLRGARRTLPSVPDCFVEVHVGVGLERLGGSVGDVLSFFPQDRYELRIASEEQREFVPFSPDSSLMAARFFLIAVARADRAATGEATSASGHDAAMPAESMLRRAISGGPQGRGAPPGGKRR